MIKFTAKGGQKVILPFWAILSVEEDVSEGKPVAHITLTTRGSYTTVESFELIAEQYEKAFNTGLRFYGHAW